MKSKLPIKILPVIVAGLTLFNTVYAQPNSGLLGGLPAGSGTAIDPATGLPIQQNVWRDPNWKDPDKVLPQFSYDGIPVSEVARDLRDNLFKNEFDVLLPEDWGHPQKQGYDWLATPIHLRLKDVKASEVFNAMNLLFENNRTPLQWELKMNGNRRIALLRVNAYVTPPEAQKAEPNRMIYFVGDLIDDEKRGGMTMSDIANIVSELVDKSYDQKSEPFDLQVHNGAQLLIVKGTDKQIDFIRQALEALRRKVQLQRARQKMGEASQPTSKTNGVAEPK